MLIAITVHLSSSYSYVCMCTCWKKGSCITMFFTISSTRWLYWHVRHFVILASTWRASTLIAPYMHCWFIERTVEWCICLSLLVENACNRCVSYCLSDIYMVLFLSIYFTNNYFGEKKLLLVVWQMGNKSLPLFIKKRKSSYSRFTDHCRV